MRTQSFKILFIITVLAINCSNTFGQFTWTKFGGNPLNLNGASGSWDQDVGVPYVIFNSDSNRYEMWYTGASTNNINNAKIGFAVSSDGIVWAKYPNPVLSPGPTGWDSLCVAAASVIRENGQYKMWFTGWKDITRLPRSIGYATSPDGINWTKQLTPVLGPGTQGWETAGAGYCSVIPFNGSYMMFYTGGTLAVIGRAFSMDGISWQRDTLNNPVLTGGVSGQWDLNAYLPKVIALGNTLYLWYTAETVPNSGNSDIGLATSVDSGKTWTKYAGNPVLTRGATGSWDNLWIETGSIVLKDNTFYMWYDGGGPQTSYLDRIGLATAPLAPVSVDEELSLPLEFSLKQNYPNPFNPSTTFRYSIPSESKVIIKVYDILGNEIETLVSEEKPADTYELTWNAANLPSGVYFYQLKAGEYTAVKKMILLK